MRAMRIIMPCRRHHHLHHLATINSHSHIPIRIRIKCNVRDPLHVIRTSGHRTSKIPTITATTVQAVVAIEARRHSSSIMMSMEWR